MSNSAAIEVYGLEKKYKDKFAVAGIDLTVSRGEIFALLGPNGAGKTTTVEILEGYRKPTSGEIKVLGFNPATQGIAAQKWRNRIGIVLQSAHDSADLTVFETISHFANYYENPKNVDQVINDVGLNEKRNAKTRQLSGGQRRRLDVALGIIGSPELLFLDEPTTGFDPEARRSFTFVSVWALKLSCQLCNLSRLLSSPYPSIIWLPLGDPFSCSFIALLLLGWLLLLYHSPDKSP